MNQVRVSRAERASAAASRHARQVEQRVDTFHKARNGINVKLTQEEERAALARIKQ